MIAYINPGFIILGSITIVAVFLAIILASGKAHSENKKTKATPIGFTVISFILVFILSDGYTTKNKIEKNIALFNNKSALRCATLGTAYLVSKQTGWKLDKEDFIKDSILLNARYCEEKR